MKIIKMRVMLFIFLLISASKAEYTVRCSNHSQTSLTFEPSEDKIDGRYKVDWCTHADKDDKKWELTLKYFSSKTRCTNNMEYNWGIPPKGLSHSNFELPVTINLNCTQVCFSTILDLVFTDQCYHIKTSLSNEYNTQGDPYDSFHYIINNSTLENFISKPYASVETYKDGLVLVNWYLGHVPATLFSVNIWDNQTNQQSYATSCHVSGVLQSEVSCEAQLLPGLCYRAVLHHSAYWTSTPSLFETITDIDYYFCVPIPGVATASSSPTGEFTRVAGTAAIVLLVLAVLCAVWRCRFEAWQRRLRDCWLETIGLAPDLKFAPGLDTKPGPDTKPGLELAPKLVLAPVLDIERDNLEPILRQFVEERIPGPRAGTPQLLSQRATVQ